MAPGYIDGEIARCIDRMAAEWRELVPKLPPLPAEREAREAALRQQVREVAASA